MLDLVLKDHGPAILAGLLRRTKRRGSCLLYTGGRGPGGYGWFTHKLDNAVYFMSTAHVAMWTLKHGRVPAGRYILHTCDHPFCIEPTHLWAGTPAQNMQDKVAKGRQTRGSQFQHAKLNEDKVRQLRVDYTRGVSMPTLAKRYRVSLQAIACAIHRKTWKHVD